MKIPILLSAAFVCAAPVWAQNAAPPKGLPFPVMAFADAEKTAVGAPFKLDLDGVTLAVALAELQKQSGVKFDWTRNAPEETLAKTLSIHLETRAFNRAFAEIIDEAGVKASLQRNDPSGPWRVAWGQSDGATDALQSETGLSRIRLIRLNTTLSKTADLNKAEGKVRSETDNLNVTLSLLPDLRLPIVGSPQTRVTRAEDDKGRSLQLPTDENQRRYYDAYNFYNNNYEGNQSNLRLLTPDKSAVTLAHLDGVVTYALITKTQQWEIPDLLSEKQWTREFKSGDQTFQVTLKPTIREDKNLGLAVEVNSNRATVDNQIGPPLLAVAPILGAMKIVDANGKVLRSNGGGGGYNPQKLTTSIVFYAGDPYADEDAKKVFALPLKLVFDAPTEIVQSEVPFSFVDVPLP